MNIDETTIRRVIEAYGTPAQTWQLSEECTELSLAIQKYMCRGQEKHRKNLIEEIADVNIMIAQANLMFPAEEIQAHIDYKLDRMNHRIDNGI